MEQPVPDGSVSVSLLCIHPATLRLTLSVGNHKRVSDPERHLLCEAPPYPLHALCQSFLNHSVRTVAVNDISLRPRGHRGKAKARGESHSPQCSETSASIISKYILSNTMASVTQRLLMHCV